MILVSLRLFSGALSSLARGLSMDGAWLPRLRCSYVAIYDMMPVARLTGHGIRRSRHRGNRSGAHSIRGGRGSRRRARAGKTAGQLRSAGPTDGPQPQLLPGFGEKRSGAKTRRRAPWTRSDEESSDQREEVSADDLIGSFVGVLRPGSGASRPGF